ncbi:MAG: hypothetical protein P1V97_07005 [Planctomycetota bacterium]|nr:hypothetical protein [Planctomycetota bacterium]
MARAAQILDKIQNSFRENPVLEVADRRYVLGEKPIAKGGMGLVYAVTVEGNTAFPFNVYDRKRRLYQVEETLTKAVLKIPFADQEFARQAIRTEREALERPAHPNVVRLLEVIQIPIGGGETIDGLVLERLLPSPTELLSTGPLEDRTGTDTATAIEMLANLLKALNTIHYHKRIYLCDIKPLNMLLRVGWSAPDAEAGRPRDEYVRRLSNGDLQWAFIDLGIAVPREAVNSKTKSFIGSTEYSPPESVIDFILSERRDVYSLVATFAEMLTGKKPYLTALLDAKRRFQEAMEKAKKPGEKKKLLSRRGRMAFEAVRDAMKDGVAPYDYDKVLNAFQSSPECSKIDQGSLDKMTVALQSVFEEGLHPDPKQRATADRLFQIMRTPFAINARATESFLDDYFMVRFRQNILPRATEVISKKDNAAYHFTGLPQETFNGYFEMADSQAIAPGPAPVDDLAPLFQTIFEGEMPNARGSGQQAPAGLDEDVGGFEDGLVSQAGDAMLSSNFADAPGPGSGSYPIRDMAPPPPRPPTGRMPRPATGRMPRPTGRLGPPPGAGPGSGSYPIGEPGSGSYPLREPGSGAHPIRGPKGPRTGRLPRPGPGGPPGPRGPKTGRRRRTTSGGMPRGPLTGRIPPGGPEPGPRRGPPAGPPPSRGPAKPGPQRPPTGRIPRTPTGRIPRPATGRMPRPTGRLGPPPGAGPGSGSYPIGEPGSGAYPLPNPSGAPPIPRPKGPGHKAGPGPRPRPNTGRMPPRPGPQRAPTERQSREKLNKRLPPPGKNRPPAP